MQIIEALLPSGEKSSASSTTRALIQVSCIPSSEVNSAAPDSVVITLSSEETNYIQNGMEKDGVSTFTSVCDK
jgi:hypothetical protein